MQRVKLWGCFGSRAPEQAREEQLLHPKVRIKLEDIERIGSEQRAIVEKIASVALES